MCGWTNVTGDTLITTSPGYLNGVVVLASVAGGDVTVYDGRDATNGRKVGTFKGAANISRPIIFTPSLLCENGVYVDVGSNITEALVLWCPFSEYE